MPAPPAIIWTDTGFSGGYPVRRFEALGFFYTYDISGHFWRSADGITWSALNGGAAIVAVGTNILDLQYDPVTSTLVAVGEKSGVFGVGVCMTSGDAGVTWTGPYSIIPGQTSFDRFRAGGVVVTSSGRYVTLNANFITTAGYYSIAYSDDQGVTWAGVLLPDPFDGAHGAGTLSCIVTDGTTVVVSANAGSGPYAFTSHDQGATWAAHAIAIPGGATSLTLTTGVYWPAIGYYFESDTDVTTGVVYFSADGDSYSQIFAGPPPFPDPSSIDERGHFLVYSTTGSTPFLVIGNDSWPSPGFSWDGLTWDLLTDPLITAEGDPAEVAFSPSLNRIIANFTGGTILYGDFPTPPPPPPGGCCCVQNVLMTIPRPMAVR